MDALVTDSVVTALIARENAPAGGIDSPFFPTPYLNTLHGVLYAGDCRAVLPFVRSESVDTVFADPPFNLGKAYGPRFDDAMSEDGYMAWCRSWLAHCVRVLAPGGSLFLYNLPKWNQLLGARLMDQGLAFRHDIGDTVKAGEVVAELVDPASGARTPVAASEGGLLFARASARFAMPGQRLGKVAGTVPIQRGGRLLSP